MEPSLSIQRQLVRSRGKSAQGVEHAVLHELAGSCAPQGQDDPSSERAVEDALNRSWSSAVDVIGGRRYKCRRGRSTCNWVCIDPLPTLQTLHV